MSDLAIDTLVGLTTRLREAGDAATASEALAQAQTIAQEESLVPTRALGAALIDLASALVPWGPGPAVQALFVQAERVLKAAGDARIDDWLVLWHNLSALYAGYGIPEGSAELRDHIANVAGTWTGPLEGLGVRVLLEEAMGHRRDGHVEQMLACLRQVHRHRNADSQPAPDRASWLTTYAQFLAEAGSQSEANAVLAEAIDLAHSQGDREHEAGLLTRLAAGKLALDDVPGAATALDRAQALVAQPPLADTPLAAAVAINQVVVVLRQPAQPRDTEALSLCARTIDLLRRLGQGDSEDCAYALYYQGQLSERLGDRVGAARHYRAAAAVAGAKPADAAEWLSLAGDALLDRGDYDAAGDCYLDAVRHRVSQAAA